MNASRCFGVSFAIRLKESDLKKKRIKRKRPDENKYRTLLKYSSGKLKKRLPSWRALSRRRSDESGRKYMNKQ
jgi:hypothetical protein